MAKTTRRMPDLSNYTPGGIVDVCAPEQLEFNRLKNLTEYYKTALKARLSDDMKIDPLTYVVEGEKYFAVISHETRTGLDLSKVRELLTEEQLAECTYTSAAMVVRFQPKIEESTEGDKEST